MYRPIQFTDVLNDRGDGFHNQYCTADQTHHTIIYLQTVASVCILHNVKEVRTHFV